MSAIRAESSDAFEQAGIGLPHYGGAALRLTGRHDVSLLRLQSTLPHEQNVAHFEDRGITLPARVNGCTGSNPAVLCLAPRDWLLVGRTAGLNALERQLDAAIDRRRMQLLDLSSAFAAVRLQGDAVPWLLQKLCALDIGDGIANGAGCARTRLEQAAAILHYQPPEQPGEPYAFDLIFERSLVRYVWLLLLNAAPHAEELLARHGTIA